MIDKVIDLRTGGNLVELTTKLTTVDGYRWKAGNAITRGSLKESREISHHYVLLLPDILMRSTVRGNAIIRSTEIPDGHTAMTVEEYLNGSSPEPEPFNNFQYAMDMI